MNDGNYLKKEFHEYLLSNVELSEFLFNRVVDGVCYWDIENQGCRWISSGFWQMLGYEAVQPAPMSTSTLTLSSLSKAWKEAAYPSDLTIMLENIHEHFDNPSVPIEQIVRYRHKSGSTIWVQCSGCVTRNQLGRPISLLLIMNDVTERKEVELENSDLSGSLNELRLVLNSVSDGIYKVDTLGRVTYINPAALRRLGFEAKDIVGKQFHALVQHTAINGVASKFEDSAIYKVVQGQKDLATTHDVYWTKARHALYVECKASSLKDGDKIVGAVVVFRDITTDIETAENLEYLVHHDELTALPNRAYFLEYLDKSIAKMSRHMLQMALVYIDLDAFTYINNEYGRDFGDKFLKVIAERIQKFIRNSDFAARLGGDQFVVLLDNIVDNKHVSKVVQCMLTSLSKPLTLEGKELKIACSMGISLFPDNGQSSLDLLRDAERAMSQSKKQGGNRISWYSDEMNDSLVRENYLSKGLYNAIKHRDLALVFQPIYSRDRKLQGFEALSRWHFKGEQIEPGEFISISEKSHLSESLGVILVKQALDCLLEWRNNFDFHGFITINLSIVQLRDYHFIEYIANLLKDTGIPPGTLILEIDEAQLDSEIMDCEFTFSLIRKYGLSLALDDFGTGRTSLHELKNLPISCLKIDPSYLTRVPGDEQANRTLSAILNFGKSMDMETIIEGVESEEQARWLSDYDCLHQGYFYAKPADRRSCEALMH